MREWLLQHANAKDILRVVVDSGDTIYALSYAMDVLHGRFPEGERYIMGNANLIYNYARSVIKGRWKEAEPALLKTQQWSVLCDYAKAYTSSRWPEFESVLLSGGVRAEFLVRYAHEVLHGRWKAAEPIIAKSALASMQYAHLVLGGRFIAGETAIIADGRFTTDYNSAFGANL